MGKTRILVVDDEYKLVAAIKAYLEHEGFEVVGCYNGKEAIECFEQMAFEAIVLDLMLPDISGYELCKMIRSRSQLPILMLTAKSDEDSIVEGLNIGADDYMTKPFSPRQLVARILALLRRNQISGMDDRVLSYSNGELIINEFKIEVVVKNQQVKLTPIEFKLLVLLAKNKDRVFTREALLAALLDDPYNSFDRIIDNHIKNLRQKIETDSKNPVYIQTVHGVGYTFRGGRDEKI